MPVYEYKCNSCSKIFELFVRSSEDMSDIRCPECNADSVKRIMSSYSAFGSQQGDSDLSGSSNSYPSCGCGGSSCGI